MLNPNDRSVSRAAIAKIFIITLSFFGVCGHMNHCYEIQSGTDQFARCITSYGRAGSRSCYQLSILRARFEQGHPHPKLVEARGFEPLTSGSQSSHSPQLTKVPANQQANYIEARLRPLPPSPARHRPVRQWSVSGRADTAGRGSTRACRCQRDSASWRIGSVNGYRVMTTPISAFSAPCRP